MEVINFSADNIIPETEVEQLLNGAESAPDNSLDTNNSTSTDNFITLDGDDTPKENNNKNKTISTEELTFDDNLEFPESVGGEKDDDINQHQEDG